MGGDKKVRCRMTFTDFERDLLQWFIDHSSSPALTAQLIAATPLSREYTGAGLYLDLSVPTSAQQLLPSDLSSPIDGPQISASSLLNGAGCLLWLEKGFLDCVEVHTYMEAMFGDLDGYRFSAS